MKTLTTLPWAGLLPCKREEDQTGWTVKLKEDPGIIMRGDREGKNKRVRSNNPFSQSPWAIIVYRKWRGVKGLSKTYSKKKKRGGKKQELGSKAGVRFKGNTLPCGREGSFREKKRGMGGDGGGIFLVSKWV